MSIKKIVLTGGPCAGKTTALIKIKEHLENKGYNVILVNESATELINSGVKPFGENAIENYEFQKIILNYQLQKENFFENIKFQNNQDTIIVYDRGTIDNKAYLNNDKFNLLLNETGLNEISLLEHYDLIIHLVTAANGAEKFYTLANNSARTETIEEAREKDLKTQTSWLGHDDLKIISNDSNFDTKIQKTINYIDYVLQDKIIKEQKKYLLEDKFVEKLLDKIEKKKMLLNQHYILEDNNIYRLREKILNKHSSYSISNETLIGNGSKIISDLNNISEKNYEIIKNNNQDKIRSLSKLRYYFIYYNQYLKLDKLQDGRYILESDYLDDLSTINLPIKEDVTNKDEYYGFQLSKKL